MTDIPTTMERAYRVRLYPKPDQARLLNRIFGARRYVWNWALERKNDAWRTDGTKLSWVDLSREFTALRQAENTAWLSELPREPFNQTLRDFDAAWRNWLLVVRNGHAGAGSARSTVPASRSISATSRTASTAVPGVSPFRASGHCAFEQRS